MRLKVHLRRCFTVRLSWSLQSDPQLLEKIKHYRFMKTYFSKSSDKAPVFSGSYLFAFQGPLFYMYSIYKYLPKKFAKDSQVFLRELEP